jgi:hypothetical protein
MAERPQAPVPSPGVIMVFLEEKAIEIDELGKALEAAHLELGDAEAEWEQKLDGVLIKIVEEHKAEGERVPAADIRMAMARERVGFEPYGRYIRAKRNCEGLEKHGRMLDTAISARQSTLRGLQEEARMPQVDPDTGEILVRGGRR